MSVASITAITAHSAVISESFTMTSFVVLVDETGESHRQDQVSLNKSENTNSSSCIPSRDRQERNVIDKHRLVESVCMLRMICDDYRLFGSFCKLLAEVIISFRFYLLVESMETIVFNVAQAVEQLNNNTNYVS